VGIRGIVGQALSTYALGTMHYGSICKGDSHLKEECSCLFVCADGKAVKVKQTKGKSEDCG
jgi:hypothetical protein